MADDPLVTNPEAKDATRTVLEQLVEALVKHYPPMTRSDARRTIRETLMEL
jgi:histone H3/H4